jgi:hypothetical protein
MSPLRPLLLWSMLALALLPACAQMSIWLESLNKSIAIVPAPGQVTIDGTLDDWDLSGEILSYDFPIFAEERHARSALMYDAHGLYLSVRVRDGSPMVNYVDGRNEKNGDGMAAHTRGWEGDAVQLRLASDPLLGYPLPNDSPSDALAHLTMWYCTARKESQLNVTRGMDYHDSQNYCGAESGMAIVPTKGGYILEACFPWALLRAPSAPAPGVRWPLTIQFHFGDGARIAAAVHDLSINARVPYQHAECWGYGTFLAAGNLDRQRDGLPKPLEVPKLLDFHYEMPVTGVVSAGLVNEKGRLMRTLLAAAPRKAGQHSERWDGLDDAGAVLPAGPYRLNIVVHEGIQERWMVRVPPGGAETPPITPAIACGGNLTVLLWGSELEGANLTVCDLDGRKQWGLHWDPALGTPTAVATDGKLVYLACGGTVYVYDGLTGKPALTRPRLEVKAPIADLVCASGRLYALTRGEVLEIALGSGTVARRLPITGDARGLALAPDGKSLLFTTAEGVQRLELATGHTASLIPASLPHATDIAVTPDGSRVFVAETGRAGNCVRVYTLPSALGVGTVGIPGGRSPVGGGLEVGLYRPTSLCCDRAGRVWVAEGDGHARRASTWLPEGMAGKLLAEWFAWGDYRVAGRVEDDTLTLPTGRWQINWETAVVTAAVTTAPPAWPPARPTIQGAHLRHLGEALYLLTPCGIWQLPAEGGRSNSSRFGSNWIGVRYWLDLNGDGQTQGIEVQPDRATLTAPCAGKDQAWPGARPWAGSPARALEAMAWDDAGAFWRGWIQRLPAPLERRSAGSAVCLWTTGGKRAYLLTDEGIVRATPGGTRLWISRLPSREAVLPLAAGWAFLGAVDTGRDRVGEVVGVSREDGSWGLVTEDGLWIADIQPSPQATGVLPLAPGELIQPAGTKRVYHMRTQGGAALWTVEGLQALRRLSGTLTVTPENVESATQAIRRARGPK